MIIENIYTFLDFKGITAYQISKVIGVSNGYLAKTRQNKGNVGGHILEKMVSYYPEINSEWLLTGKGEMLRSQVQEILHEKLPSSNIDNRPIIEITPKQGKPNTLVADIKASAGFGAIMQDHKELEQLPSILLPNVPFGLNVAFQISGDSMHPTIRHSDFVAANQLNGIEDIRDGYTYIIIDKDDGVLCKRIYRKGKNIQIKSDNPDYPPYTRSFDYILGVFKCFMRLSTDFRTYHNDIRNEMQELRTDVKKLKKKLRT